jgi:hypothetical protein
MRWAAFLLFVLLLVGEPLEEEAKLSPRHVEANHHPKRVSRARRFPAVLVRIRECESGGDYQARNQRSSASGAYQFLGSTWNNYRGYESAADAPRHVQDIAALRLFRRRGTQPWDASRSCWQ